MGNQNGQSKETKPQDEAGGIKVILCDSQAIYRVGLRKVFALEDDLRVVAQAESLGQSLAAAAKHAADVILFESAISPNPPEAISEVMKRCPTAKIVVLVPELNEDETVEYLRRGVRGIVTRSISPDLVVRCIRKVFEGETWLDNKGVSWVIEAYRSQATALTQPRQKTRLSDKELLIISYVTQGMRNKEIAQEVGTTEQVVKNYLRKIYDKLGVSDRLELALYCVHHRLLHAAEAAAQSQSMPAATAAAAGRGTESPRS